MTVNDSTSTGTGTGTSTTQQVNSRRWHALVFISVAQLMVAVDSTIVNIALPSAQVDLGISDANRQWVITAYLLAFGGLLLLGGRISDMAGRLRTFIIGVAGFGVASILGGAAATTGLLLTARGLQGVFAALMVPAGLALLSVTFAEPKERAKAFGAFAAIAGSGAAVGLILGGVLTEYLSWRWALYVNAPISLVVTIGAFLTIHEARERRSRGPLDIAGALLVTSALMALIYGLTRAESDGWTSSWTWGPMLSAAALLVVFVFVESKVRSPLLPLRVLTERNRAGVYLSQALSVMTMFGLLLLLTYYFQAVREFSAIESGLAFLPLVAGMLIGASQISGRLMSTIAPRWLIGPGCLISAAGMLLLTQLEVGSLYVVVAMPAQLIFGVGLGMAFTPSMSLATHAIEADDAGVASAMINGSQQVGGSIGAALLNTIAASATTAWIVDQGRAASQNEAVVHGYSVGAYWAVGIMLLAATASFIMINATPPNATTDEAFGGADMKLLDE